MAQTSRGRRARRSALSASFDVLESRALFSADPAGFAEHGYAPVNWGGQDTFARPGEWVVRLDGLGGDAGQKLAAAKALAHKAGGGLDVVESLGADGLFKLTAPAGAAAGQLRHALGAVSKLAWLEPNFAIKLQQTRPNDPSFSRLWAMENTGQTSGTGDADADATEAWDLATGSSDVVVAVVDSGVDYNHPDLAANMWTNSLEAGGVAGQDDDGNGYVDDVYGYDSINNDGNPIDDHDHGSHVAGTIAAVGDNGVGVAGVSWNSRIMAVKVVDAGGYGDSASAIKGLSYVHAMAQRGVNVRVANASWGGDPYNQGLYDAIRQLQGDNILFAAAAGNGDFFGRAINNDATPFYPAGYDLDNVISVAATDANDLKASWSNYGATTVDLGAPGVGIYSTVRNGGYVNKDGTSMAAPHVSGAAALAAAYAPGAGYTEIKRAILDGADRVASLAGKTLTGARLNVHNTLQLLGPADAPAHDAPTLVRATTASATAINVSWADNSANESGFKIERSTDGVNWLAIDGGTVGANVKTFADAGLTPDTMYSYRVTAYNGFGESAPSAVGVGSTIVGGGTGLRGDYYDNMVGETGTLSGWKFARTDATVNATWGSGAPTQGNAKVQQNTFSVKWTGMVQPRFTDDYTFRFEPDDGVGMWITVDGVKKPLWTPTWDRYDGTGLDGTSTEYANSTAYESGAVALQAGVKYPVEIIYYEYTGNASAKLLWRSANYQKQEIIPASQLYHGPTDLKATAVSSSRVDLAWTDNAGDEGGFKIERSTDGVNFTQIATVGANVTSFANTGLAASATYTYRVRAYNGTPAFNSAYSRTATAKTLATTQATTAVASAGTGTLASLEGTADVFSSTRIPSVGDAILGVEASGMDGGADPSDLLA